MVRMKLNKAKPGIILLGAIIITVCLFLFVFGEGPQEEKVYHVGILSGLDYFSGIADSFKEEMTNLGYTDGKNIVYDLEKTNFEPEKERQILQKFVNDKVDLIMTFPTEVSLLAKEVTEGTDVPLVFAACFVEGNDMIESISHPGDHVTGVRYPGTDVAVKRLEILYDLLPNATRIWLPYQADYPAVPAELQVVRQSAESLNITLIEFPVTDLVHLQEELENRYKSDNFDFDAVLYMPESLSTNLDAFGMIANYTRDLKIPIAGTRIVTDDYGTLFGVTTNNPEFGVLAAPIADKILKGTPAGTIFVTSASQHIKINYKVAEELGIKVPDSLLAVADEIIR